MAKKKYTFQELVNRKSTLSTEQQKSLKGGRNLNNFRIETVTRAVDWTEIDIRSPRKKKGYTGNFELNNGLDKIT